jgi:hypothetical protein
MGFIVFNQLKLKNVFGGCVDKIHFQLEFAILELSFPFQIWGLEIGFLSLFCFQQSIYNFSLPSHNLQASHWRFSVFNLGVSYLSCYILFSRISSYFHSKFSVCKFEFPYLSCFNIILPLKPFIPKFVNFRIQHVSKNLSTTWIWQFRVC